MAVEAANSWSNSLTFQMLFVDERNFKKKLGKTCNIPTMFDPLNVISCIDHTPVNMSKNGKFSTASGFNVS